MFVVCLLACLFVICVFSVECVLLRASERACVRGWGVWGVWGVWGCGGVGVWGCGGVAVWVCVGVGVGVCVCVGVCVYVFLCVSSFFEDTALVAFKGTPRGNP